MTDEVVVLTLAYESSLLGKMEEMAVSLVVVMSPCYGCSLTPWESGSQARPSM